MPSDLPGLELMLHVATARGIMNWASWREAYESVMTTGYLPSALPPLSGTRILDSLGHIEVASVDGDFKVAAAPAVLARLPRAGLPAAVLCGGRSPQTERKVLDAANENGCRFAQFSTLAPRLMPRAFIFESDTESALESTAQGAGIEYARIPPSWALLQGCGTNLEYLASLIWRHEPEPPLEAAEIDPSLMRLGPARKGASGLRLIRYFPRKLPAYFELRDGEKAARAERDWGLYALLSEYGCNRLVHDRHAKIVAVPNAAPLPRLLARALVLCSGLAPAWLPAEKADWPLPEQIGYYLYSGVPDAFAEILFSKLGQNALPLNVPREIVREIQSQRFS